MRTVTRTAYGKINLSLDVTGRREDGYHLVRMIMQTVDLSDTLEFETDPAGTVSMTCNKSEVPVDGTNLIVRAIELLREKYDIKEGVKVKLTKRIPVAAGMAGGSTDAAAALLAARELFSLPADDEELAAIGLSLGADIPYCLKGGTMLSEGIGEILTQLPDAPQCTVLLCTPTIAVSTGKVYKALDSLENVVHPDIDAMTLAIGQGSLEKVSSLAGNVLELVTGQDYPVISEIETFFKENGALNSIMSGSGPTVFAIFDDKDKADKCFELLKEHPVFGNYQISSTKFVYPKAL